MLVVSRNLIGAERAIVDGDLVQLTDEESIERLRVQLANDQLQSPRSRLRVHARSDHLSVDVEPQLIASFRRDEMLPLSGGV